MQLLYPWFLAALATGAIPVVIHLLQLRRPQRVLFTNTAFIREVELMTIRHRNIQRWLILAARVASLAALVLLFCQPFIPAKNNSGNSLNRGVNVLVDNSLSMQRQTAGAGSLFNSAIENAGKLGKSMAAGIQLRLINNSNSALGQANYQTRLNELKQAVGNPFAKINQNTATRDLSRAPLYVFSDFQKNAVAPAILKQLGAEQEVVLMPLVAKAEANLYVDSVWWDDAFVRMRTNVPLHVRVRNGGNRAASEYSVKVFLNDRQVSAFQVTVQPGQAATVVVQVQLLDGAVALGRVVTEDAPVTFDNTYFFTLQAAAAIRVLEIGAEPMAQSLYANEPLFRYAYAAPQRVDYGVLRQANLVVVREVAAVDAGLREGLRGVVNRGGSVVVVPSAEVSGHASYQQLFQELGLGVVQWTATTRAPELREVAMPSAQNPFFRDVFGAEQRAVTMPRVAPVLRWSRTGSDILRLRDGDSYLAEFGSGAGRVYVFSAPFAKAYSDFTRHALFVPVMYRLAMLSYHNEQRPAYRLTQASLTLRMTGPPDANRTTGRSDESRLRLVKDSLTLVPAQRVVGQEVRLELPVGMDSPGFYQVQAGGKVLTTLAFNQNPRESELAAYSADELRRLAGPHVRVLEGGPDGPPLTAFRAEQTGTPLWRYCVALALAGLLAEALLVRFGRASAARTPTAG